MGLKQGTLLKNGEYRIEKVLGQGGFGITYLAVQVALDRKVAIKEFFMKGVCERDAETSQVSISNADNKELVSRFREKFLKEARSIASLEHRNIVSVIDVFECNGTAYYVMKHLGGASLADKVKQGALPEADAVRYIRQVASALEYVHGRNMMHLDVKPANILLDDTDNAVLIDFGLAKQYDTEGQQTSTTPVGISHGYAPMEQYRRGGVSSFSPASDIYSLGATLYKLVTGATPPEASDINDDGLPVLPDSISPAVRSAIEAAMLPKRKDRPQSIEAFLEMIERATGKDESGKSGGSDDCPPLLMGTSVAEVVNESPATDDGETVVENSADTVISNNSRSCHPERNEGSHPAGSLIFRDKPSTTRSNEREKSPKSANKEILPSSGRQNDKIVNGRQNDNANSNKRGWSWILILLWLPVVGIVAWLMFAGGGTSNSTASKKDTKVNEGEASAVQIQYKEFNVGEVKFRMVAVDGGTFQMGATSEQQNAVSDEKPVHSVTLSDYYIGETEVTQELWQAVMGSNPSRFTGNRQIPVEQVTWYDCQDFVNKLNDLCADQLPAGKKFRLPSEAEWEYAARGGKNSSKTQYGGSDNLAEVAWYGEDWETGSSHRVKKKATNELGLYDMSGNVWEWCFDSYASYTDKAQTNPKVDKGTGSRRVLRGGCWDEDARCCRVAYRNHAFPSLRVCTFGLRLAL